MWRRVFVALTVVIWAIWWNSDAGRTEVGAAVKSSTRLTGSFVGPESTAFDQSESIYFGTIDGKIVRIPKSGGEQIIGHVGGRPLGLVVVGDAVIVAEASRGLLGVDIQTGVVSELAVRSNDGIPIHYADDVDVAPDGSIYFSDASTIAPEKLSNGEFDTMQAAIRDLVSYRPSGRLLRYDPSTKSTSVVARDLWFSNGVAVSQKGDFVAVAETGRYRVLRFWTDGRPVSLDVLVDLPGMPDGVSRAPDGGFWIAIVSPKNKLMEWVRQIEWLSDLFKKLPPWCMPPKSKTGLAIKVDEQGKILRTLYDPTGRHISMVTSAVEHDGKLYLGNLYEPHVTVVDLNQ